MALKPPKGQLEWGFRSVHPGGTSLPELQEVGWRWSKGMLAIEDLREGHVAQQCTLRRGSQFSHQMDEETGNSEAIQAPSLQLSMSNPKVLSLSEWPVF